MTKNEEILEKVKILTEAHKKGLLGGEKMPEDKNPSLSVNSKENYMYFTLPMALNYQRDSYTLWKCANLMYDEVERAFDSAAVCGMDEAELRTLLVRYKVALQPNKQPVIWKTICNTIEAELGGDIRNIFSFNDYSVEKTKDYIVKHKKSYPYLCGPKICNYWLYVLEKYTDIKFTDRDKITVAPDTHVIQASLKLNLITESECKQVGVQRLTAERWAEILKNTKLAPIDIHTTLWLWSRGKFAVKLW